MIQIRPNFRFIYWDLNENKINFLEVTIKTALLERYCTLLLGPFLIQSTACQIMSVKKKTTK